MEELGSWHNPSSNELERLAQQRSIRSLAIKQVAEAPLGRSSRERNVVFLVPMCCSRTLCSGRKSVEM